MLLCGELSAKVPSLRPLSKKRVLIGWNKSFSVASCLFFGGGIGWGGRLQRLRFSPAEPLSACDGGSVCLRLRLRFLPVSSSIGGPVPEPPFLCLLLFGSQMFMRCLVIPRKYQVGHIINTNKKRYMNISVEFPVTIEQSLPQFRVSGDQ